MRIKPFISIIVPVYNSARTLYKCIECVVHQSYTNWELIIIDSDSSDRTPSIAKEWSDKLGERCRYYNVRKRNIAFARNFGVRVSRGERIFTLESDEYLTPHILEECVKKAQDGYSGVGIPARRTWLNKGYIPACRYHLTCEEGDPDPLPNFVPRQLWFKIGGQDEELGSVLEDFDFGLKFTRQGYSIARIEGYIAHDADASLKQLIRRSLSSVIGEKKLYIKWTTIIPSSLTKQRGFFALKKLSYLVRRKPKLIPGALLIILLAVITRKLGALLLLFLNHRSDKLDIRFERCQA